MQKVMQVVAEGVAAMNSLQRPTTAAPSESSSAAHSAEDPHRPMRTLKEETMHACDAHMAAELSAEHYAQYDTIKECAKL